jgi:hypothetical protein
MKLYTEEQVQEAYNKGHMDGKLNNTDYSITDGFKPIELPSDEEIIDNAPDDTLPLVEFIAGAKWMREQILGKEDKTFKQKSKWTEVDNMTRRLK